MKTFQQPAILIGNAGWSQPLPPQENDHADILPARHHIRSHASKLEGETDKPAAIE
jgi:hypothetical protein